LAFLADSASHGVGARRIDTHAASVFLAGERALKVKRAVRFPFLDYSTLKKRKAACETELAVNRPLAPDIYRRVVPITREADGRLALDGKGAVVEWVVEMRRFDEKQTLDHVAERGELDTGLADTLGRAVAQAHAAAPVVDAEPWTEALASFLDQNATAFREMPERFPPHEAEALDRASRAAFARIRPLLLERGRLGLVRRGHGDLHLGNIVLIDGRPVLFDAIEFDPLIAAGDVLYDLAFLLMDLTERGLHEAANIVFNRYLAETRRNDDLDGLAALPFFLSLRAAIRAKVTAARIERVEEGERDRIAQSATTYFRLACDLISPPPPLVVAVGGLSGTGKSVLARALAPGLWPAPGAVVLRSDVERKALFGVTETTHLPPEGYAREATARVYASLAEKARRVVGVGHSAIVDAVYARPDERADIVGVARSAQAKLRGLFLSADLDTRLARIGARAHDASDADAAVALAQEHYALGALDWTVIDASGSPAETLARAQAALIS
jgi:aminoglycoside phosphotransferase family enzyme/predicted kinase